MIGVKNSQPRPKRGFAAISKKRQREIASMGGRMAHAKGTAHRWTSETAREAGLKGVRAKLHRGGLGQIADTQLMKELPNPSDWWQVTYRV